MSAELTEGQQIDKLTLKQSLFVEAYLGEAKGNGVESARIAGYSGDDETLAVVASENLRKPNIASRVRERLSAAAASADVVLKELTEIALRDDREFVQVRRNGKGEVIDASVVLRDKIRALELLGKYHKLFTEKIETKDTTPVKGEAEKQAELDRLFAETEKEISEKVN